MYRSVLYLCAIVLFYVESFPLDEDVCDNNNYFSNLQAYNSDELELYEDACPAPRGFNRREIPLRFRREYEDDLGINEKSLEGYQEDMYLGKRHKYNKQIEEHESSNESNNPMDLEEPYQPLSKYCHRQKSHHKFNSFHEKPKSKRPKYDSYFMKYAGAKSYRVPPFETFYKSYSQYRAPGMKELNTENLEEIVEVNKKPQSMEIEEDIKEEMIDKPTDVEEVNVERVIKESNDKSNENSEDKNEENVKEDKEDNRENSENDEEEQDETEEEEEDSDANAEHITLKEQKSTTENAELEESHTTIHV